MASSRSVSHWIGQLRAGDPVAAQHLWEGYFRRLVGLARGKLQSLPSRAADEEDVALSAFASFCRGVEGGRFPQLADRDDLWRLLVTITAARRCTWHATSAARSGAAAPCATRPPWATATAQPPRPPRLTSCWARAHPRVRRPGGRGVSAAAGKPGRCRPAHDCGLENGRLHHRGDRRQAPARPSHRRAQARLDPPALDRVADPAAAGDRGP